MESQEFLYLYFIRDPKSPEGDHLLKGSAILANKKLTCEVIWRRVPTADVFFLFPWSSRDIHFIGEAFLIHHHSA